MKQDSRKTRGVRESGWLTRTKNNNQQGRERREEKKDGMQYAMLFLSIEGTMSCFFVCFFFCMWQ